MLWKYKKAYQETNEDIPLLPLYSFCYEGFWECLDEVHDCPGLCGFVTYLDEIGIEHTQSGICIDDGIITIEASSIVQTSGVSLVDCYNFDVTADWENIVDYPVIDETSFTDFLENYVGSNSGSNLININISDFNLIADRLQCNLFADGTSLDLGSIGATSVLKIGNINGLTELSIGGNPLSEFNLITPLPNTLEILDIPACQIIDFNPQIPLNNGLKILRLNNNQIVNFNPSTSLPTSLEEISLYANQITTAGYIISETWANAQPTFISTCDIDFTFNINSVSGTNLETILLSKNCNVVS